MENHILLLLSGILLIGIINLVLQLVRKSKNHKNDFRDIKTEFGNTSRLIQDLVINEFKSSREETSRHAKDGQNILNNQLTTLSQGINGLLTNFQQQLGSLTKTNQTGFNEFRDSISKSLTDVRFEINKQLESIQKDTSKQLDKVNHTVDEKLQNTLDSQISNLSKSQTQSLKSFQDQLNGLVKSNQDGFKNMNDGNTKSIKLIESSLSSYSKNIQTEMKGLRDSNDTRFEQLRESINKCLGDMRVTISNRLETIQKDNNTQLEKMRETVDEKLQKTLEKRLGQSFELVSKRLEEVQKGLGEMQNLANGVGDLKKVLTNVKTRGAMGEIQLGNILDQLLTTEQYSVNVKTIPGSQCHVEFAIRLPGRDKDQKEIWLPIDSKFPMDKYAAVQDAYDSGDQDLIKIAQKDLKNTIKSMAKDIRDKYIQAPYTTDFGIMFLPTEGLFADVVRDADLVNLVQNEYKIMLAGPTNLAALLNSLQMGFRSLAIEKRSSEVWKVLGAVKSEFGKFGAVLDKVQTKLQQASKTIDTVGVRTRAIERNLRSVETLPSGDEVVKELPFDDGVDIEDFMNVPNQLDS